MIDLDMLLKAARKPWYCRSEAEENMLSSEFIADASARIRQAEKDAERYRWLRDKACHSEWHTVGSADPSVWDVIIDEYIDEAMQCSK